MNHQTQVQALHSACCWLAKQMCVRARTLCEMFVCLQPLSFFSVLSVSFVGGKGQTCLIHGYVTIPNTMESTQGRGQQVSCPYDSQHHSGVIMVERC